MPPFFHPCENQAYVNVTTELLPRSFVSILSNTKNICTKLKASLSFARLHGQKTPCKDNFSNTLQGVPPFAC
jgi:hypothetical protein